MPAFIHRAAQALSSAAIALAFTAAPALGADSAAASAPRDPFTLEAGDSSYPIGRVLTPETWARRSEPGVIRLAVSSFLGPNANYAVIKPTIRALQAEFGRDRVYAEVFSGDRIQSDRDDLVMSSSGTYRRAVGQGSRDLASLVSDRFPDPDHAEGSVFAVLRGPAAPKRLSGLKGRRLAASGEMAFTGYQVGMNEIFLAGFDPSSFFGSIRSTGHDMMASLDLLRRGEVDAAILRTCFLEELERRGIDVSDIAVIHGKTPPESFRCRASTALYPNWTVSMTPHATPEVARRAAMTLLAMPAAEGGLRWSIATDFTSVDRLLFNLKLGPYEYLRHWSLARFWSEYRIEILLALALVAALALHTWRSDRLVAERTRELEAAFARERRLAEEKERAAEHLRSLQKSGLVGQMSSMVAHELRQPLTAIVSYCQGLQRLLENPGPRAQKMLPQGLDAIEREAQKADGIVAKVRRYAKGASGMSERREIDLAAVVRRSIADVSAALPAAAPVEAHLPASFPVAADPLEMEVAAANLLKNALEASALAEHPGPVVVAIAERFEKGPDGPVRWAAVEVENSMQPADGRLLEALSLPLHSEKAEGLGLGLSIVKTIAENHAGRLSFELLAKDRIRARFAFPCGEAPQAAKS